MIRRSDQGALAEWWWTVDRTSFFLVLTLIGIGLMLALAAGSTVESGAMASGGAVSTLKQVAFAFVSIGLLIGASMMTPTQAFRLSCAIFALALLGTLAVALHGAELNHAKRWIRIFGMTVQPSEFLKPGFAVLGAALLSWRIPTRCPRPVLTLLLVLPAVGLLVTQPDFGQTFLLLALWATLLYFAGESILWGLGIGAGGAGILALAYQYVAHVHQRIDQYLHPKVGGGYQAAQSLKAFAHGGLFGVGPGSGTVKYRLPEAHSDYIFSVAGEEFGFLLCLTIAVLFCILAVRMMRRAAQIENRFAQLAAAGLSLVVALQAFVNMGVAIRLLPAKGMTLPFISFGGSSLFAVALTMGLALAMTRERPKIGVSHTAFERQAWGRA